MVKGTPTYTPCEASTGSRSGSALGLHRAPALGLGVHTGCPRPVDDQRLIVAGPGRHGRAGEDEGRGAGAAILERRAERDVDAHTRDESGDALLAVQRPAPTSPSPERTYQYSSMVRKRQAWPTIPGGTVEWIMLPCGPSMRKRI